MRKSRIKLCDKCSHPMESGWDHRLNQYWVRCEQCDILKLFTLDNKEYKSG